MAVSYKKLWKILIDRDMKKKDLCAAAGISHASMAKLGKSENVTTDVLVKICTALNCDIGDIMELVPDNTNMLPLQLMSFKRRDTFRATVKQEKAKMLLLLYLQNNTL